MKTFARTFGQDLMRREHVVGKGKKRRMKSNGGKTLGAIAPNEGGANGILSRTGKYAQDWQKEGHKVHGNVWHGEISEASQKVAEVTSSGTSIFDPVLCELVYTWFCPPNGKILDPFAGGSVRGIVAAFLGRNYTGIDLRSEQIQENQKQWEFIKQSPLEISKIIQDNQPDLTPVESHGDFLVKRDDLFSVAGVAGGKVRSCWSLAQGARGLITAGSRQSPQVNIVAHIAQRLGIPCRVHVPSGELTPELISAVAVGAEIIQHNFGRNSVIISRAKADAATTGFLNIPFGMECKEAVDATASQVANLPFGAFNRIVVPVGSGMSLAGIVTGMMRAGTTTPILGVVVGADPRKRIAKYAPQGWERYVELVESGLDYHDYAPGTFIGSLKLDPIYEAKCLPFLKPKDLLWIVGIRESEQKQTLMPTSANRPDPHWIVGNSLEAIPDDSYDLVFSCPPYYDLEVYSDDTEDLSTKSSYAEFLEEYSLIIKKSVDHLKDDRFACFVVGDIRDDAGIYRHFPTDTILAFERAGAALYNDAILVTAVGSLPIRVGRMFQSGRKLGKTHQNVLVFVKGDPKKAVDAIGDVFVPEILGNDYGIKDAIGS